MPTSAQQIVNLYQERLRLQAPEMTRMREVQQLVNNDVVLPLPEVDKVERPAIVNVAQQTVDQHSMRIASVLPSIHVPARREGNAAAERAAKLQRDAHYGWWGENNYKVRMRQRARYMVGYGSAPVVIRWDFERQIPVFEERNPLATFAPPQSSVADICPEDCIFGVRRNLAWLRGRYPEHIGVLTRGDDLPSHTEFDVLEYIDSEEIALVAVARRLPGQTWPNEHANIAVELERIDNRAGVCTAVLPGRVTLDRTAGMVDNLYGRFIKQAKLDALEYIAIRQQIFPKEWEQSNPGERAQVTREPVPNQGIRGQIRGGTIQRIVADPTVVAVVNSVTDRYESFSRVDANAPSQFGGENPTNVRTGRASQTLISAATEFHIQEHQELFAKSAEAEIERAVKMARAYQSRPVSFYVPWKGVREEVTYEPGDLKTDKVFVSYALPGLDAAQIPIVTGQLQGLGQMSAETAMNINPLIEDPAYEKGQVRKEAIENAVLGFIQARTQMPTEQGGLSLPQLKALLKAFGENEADPVAALEAAEKIAQEEQAARAAAPAGAPESQPGIGGDNQLVQEQVAGPLDELSLLMRSLRGSSAPVAA